MDNNKYKEYLPENRIKNQKVGLSPTGAKVVAAAFLIFIVFAMIKLFVNSGGDSILKTESRYYNLNLAEMIKLETINSDADIIWETNSDKVTIEDNKIIAMSPGTAYIIGRKGNVQVSDLTVTVLDENKEMNLEKHSIELSIEEKGKVIVNQKSKEVDQKSKLDNQTTKINNKDNQKQEVVQVQPTVEQSSSEERSGDIKNPEFEEDDQEEEINSETTETESPQIEEPEAPKEQQPIEEPKQSEGEQQREVTYTSQDPSIATVDDEGNITPQSEGTTIITVIDTEGHQDHTYVTVKGEEITFPLNEYSLKVGETTKIKYQLNKEKINEKDLTFSSDDNKIATVDNEGNIKAISVGETKIIIKVKDITKEIKITVNENIVLPTALILSADTITLNAGDSTQINATVAPNNATSKVLIWKSDNSNIASVDNNGKIHGENAGDTTVHVSTTNGITKNIKVIVNKKIITATDIKLNQNSVKLKVGEKFKINYTIIPEATTDKTIKFEYDKNYINLDNKGNVETKKAGITNVTVITSNGKSATLRIEIISPEKKASEVRINDGNLKLTEDATKTLSISVVPSDIDKTKAIWKTSNADIVEIDENGNIKAKNVGKANITVTLDNQQSSITVEVVKKIIPTTSITLNKTKIAMKAGKTDSSLKAEIKPSNATNKNVIWTSSNTKVAAVDKNGEITAYSKGTTTIKATSSDNNSHTASCTVTVTYNVSLVLEYSAKTLIKGETFTLKGKVTPKEANQDLKWSSNNTKVATVDSNGKITAKAKGTAVITAQSKEDSSKTQQCKITVNEKKTHPDGDGYGGTGYSALNGKAYLYSSTSYSSTPIAVLKGGEPFKILATIVANNVEWWKVQYNGKTGYVDSAYCMINLPDFLPSITYDIVSAYANRDISVGYPLSVYGKKLYKAGKVYNPRLGRNEFIVPVVWSLAKKLYAAQEAVLRDGYSIKIYDAYRPVDAAEQERVSLMQLYYSNAVAQNAMNYSANGSYWGPAWFIAQGVSMHSVGAAIDITLINKQTKADLPMPTVFAECSTRAIKYYTPVKSQNTYRPDLYAPSMTDAAKYLDRVMISAGFNNLASEWWHFQDNAANARIKALEPNGLYFHPTRVVSS